MHQIFHDRPSLRVAYIVALQLTHPTKSDYAAMIAGY